MIKIKHKTNVDKLLFKISSNHNQNSTKETTSGWYCPLLSLQSCESYSKDSHYSILSINRKTTMTTRHRVIGPVVISHLIQLISAENIRALRGDTVQNRDDYFNNIRSFWRYDVKYGWRRPFYNDQRTAFYDIPTTLGVKTRYCKIISTKANGSLCKLSTRL